MIRSTRRGLQFFAVTVTCALAACNGAPRKQVAAPGPGAAAGMSITAIAPSVGSTVEATQVTIDGAGFVEGTRVRFDTVEAGSVTRESDRRLIAVAPPHAAGPVDVELVAPDGSTHSGRGAFHYDDPPVLSYVDPGHLPVDGGSVILHGSHFVPEARVLFGADASVGAPRWLSGDQLVALAPPRAAGAVDVTVVNPDGQKSTLPGALVFDPPLPPPPPPPPPAPPVLSAVAPASGPESGGTAVTLTGSGFDARATATFGGSPATVTAASPGSLSVVAPPHAAGAVDVAVANPDGQTATLVVGYTYVPPPPQAPRLASLAPASGSTSGGTTVALAGSGFAPGAAVAFGGAPALVLSLSSTAIVVTSPPGPAGAADVAVRNPDGQSATLAGAFLYQAPPPPPPAISSIAPASGPATGTTSLTISGGGFAAGATVTVGGSSVAVGAVTASAIVAAVGPHAPGPADVVVVNPDGQSASAPAAFTFVAPPTLAAVSPAAGPTAGGTALTVTGSGFAAGAAVTLGGAPASVAALTASSLSIVAPPHAAGPADLLVRNPDGQAATLSGAYAYVAPPLAAAVTPSSGPVAGGNGVVVSGSGFTVGTTVTLGGLSVPIGVRSATSLSVTAPAHAAGAVDVAVQNPDGQGSTLAGAYTYLAPPPPVLASIAPASGPDSGGTPVTLAGAFFAPGATVSFGGVPAAVTSSSATLLSAIAPPHAAGAVDVVVVNPDGQSGSLAGAFLYLPPPVLGGVSPAQGTTAGGDALILTGSGFQPGATATLGGVAAPVGALTSTSMAVTSPSHAAGSVDVVVHNPDGRSAALAAAYLYVAPPPPPPAGPGLAAVSPSSGPDAGGTGVTLTGTGFLAGATVSFGGAAALVGAVSATSISAIAPAHLAGPVDVVVTNPDGQLATLAGAYTFVAPSPPPVLSSVLPASGPVAGGTAVALNGAQFAPGATVVFGALPAAVVSASATGIAVVAPAHAPGPVDVAVTNPDGQVALLPSAYLYLAPPSVASVTPASGPIAGGTAVTIAGSGFQPGAAVTFGGIAAAVASVGPTSISATAPAQAAGAVDVAVRNPDGQAATLAAAFTYVAPPPPPALISVSPSSGLTGGGTTVTLAGSGFQPGAAVSFGGSPAAVSSLTATSISAIAPAHAAGPVDVVVVNPDGQASRLAGAFSYVLPPPLLASVAPASGSTAGGTSVILAGSGFQPGASVTFGGTAATVAGLSPTSISTTAPAHAAGAVDVVVRNPDGQSSVLAGAYLYVAPPPPPALVSIAPAGGSTAGGTSVTLAGSGFQSGASVAFGGVAAAVGALGSTSITVTAPAHAAGAVDVAVQNPDGQGAVLVGGYTYVAPPPPPALASATPASGTTAGGTAVVLAGSGFAAGASVTVGGLPAAVTGVSATAISLTTPAHAAGAVDVVVRNPDGQSALLAAGYLYVAPPPPPALASVAPATGSTAGGTSVTLSGIGFASGASVTFGGALASVTGASPTALLVTTPAHAAGSVDVVVQNPDGQSSTLPGAFAYATPPAPPPVLASVSPVSGPTAGGTAVTLNGTGFAPGAAVSFGGAAAAVSAVSPTSISVTAPVGLAGPADVVVTNPDGQSATLAGGYTYLAPPPPAPPPSLAAVSPASGSTLGGNSVTLSGAAFDPAAAVTFGGVAAAVVSASPTSITAAAPAHAAGAVDVAVVNPDGQSSTLPGAYSYLAPTAAPPLITSIAPTSGTTFGGTTVTVTGKEFVNPVVSFGGSFGTLASVSATSISVLTPAHAAGTVDVVVTNGDGQSATAAAAFTYVAPPSNLPAPVIGSVTPTSGSINGNTLVTVSGSNFVTGSTVSFGGVGGFVGSVTATAITVTTPAHAAGPVDVTVLNPDHQAATLAAGYTFTAPPPVVLALSIHGSPQAGGQQVTMAGSGLQNATSVTFGGVPGTGLTYDPASGALTVFTPPSPLGPSADVFVSMVVTNVDGQSVTVPGFHYGPPPTATGFTPATGPRGAPLTISGTDFTADATGPRAGLQVSFGGTLATISSKTSTQIVVAVPKLNPGVYQVFVTNFDGQFTVSPGTFTAPGP